MATEAEYEVVSVQRLNDKTVRVGLAGVGRILAYSQMAGDPANRGVVGADLYQDWDALDEPRTGEIVATTFARTGRVVTPPETPVTPATTETPRRNER